MCLRSLFLLVHQFLRGMLEGLGRTHVSPVSMLQKTLMASMVHPWLGSIQYSPAGELSQYIPVYITKTDALQHVMRSRVRMQCYLTSAYVRWAGGSSPNLTHLPQWLHVHMFIHGWCMCLMCNNRLLAINDAKLDYTNKSFRTEVLHLNPISMYSLRCLKFMWM